ncbi:multivesicular body subunit 12Bb isoform X3 [Nothobranchius furzeri]|uniref:Transcript variant X3 n=1 Tax=Nothobranchius furzeri TaxID=105023 RepID=A0A9D3BA52_NOTFU|nr:multivesicular body subunit 12B isoform X3 [Nothobranchius furzeri]KAF7199841.1 transcript variant X3 [Nothobranchius furzeri]
MSDAVKQLPTDPISVVGVVTSISKIPDGYYVVAQTTDGSEADLWKDGLFKSKVTRYLCFSRKASPEVVVDMKVMDIKDPLPELFTPVQETIDKKEAAMRKKRLCVKMSPREAVVTALCDIQITAKSKYHLVNYTCAGRIDVSRPQYVQQDSRSYTLTALEGIPFAVSEKFHETPQKMQQVNLMGITIKSLAEIEEEFEYNFGTEFSIIQ